MNITVRFILSLYSHICLDECKMSINPSLDRIELFFCTFHIFVDSGNGPETVIGGHSSGNYVDGLEILSKLPFCCDCIMYIAQHYSLTLP